MLYLRNWKQELRAVPDDVALIKSIYKYLELSPEQVKERKENIRAKLLENYNWDKTAKRYEELFDKLEPKNMWDTPLIIDPFRRFLRLQSQRICIFYY